MSKFVAAVVLAVAALIAVSIGRAPLSSVVRAATGTVATRQLTGGADAAGTPAAAQLVVIAHNAGDAASTTRVAVAHHAKVIEIDVVVVRGVLRAAHDVPLPAIGDVLNRSRTVAQAWAEAATPAVLLDLKTNGSSTTGLAATLIAQHPTTRVLISTPDRVALGRMHVAAPRAMRLLSVRTVAELTALLASHATDPTVQGVSIADHLLDKSTANALASRHLWVQAWTVNSMARANQLAGWGINGVTTDHLGMLGSLSGIIP